MATLLKRGCVATCGFCRSEFSFSPMEASHSTTHVGAGYSPEEEAYDRSDFHVKCPNCSHGVNVGSLLGRDAKHLLSSRKKFDDIDL